MTSTKRVVINASSLITLCRSQLHVLLPQLFDAVTHRVCIEGMVVHMGLYVPYVAMHNWGHESKTVTPISPNL